MPSDSRARATGNLLFALLCAIMIGLAAGAVWMLLALYTRSALTWLALPLGAGIGWATRAWVMPAPRSAAALAALAILLAIAYMRCLLVAAHLAMLMSMGFVETLRRAGPAMLLELTRQSLGPDAWLASLLGVALAAGVAWRGRRRSDQ